VFRYELGAGAVGRFTIGPVRVHAGSEVVSSPPLTLEVVASTPSIGAPGGVGRAAVARAAGWDRLRCWWT